MNSKPLPFKKLNTTRLSEAIVCATQPGICEKAKSIGQYIATENGAKDCALVIARAMETKVDGKN